MAELFRVELQGTEDLARALRALNDRAMPALAKALFQEAETIMTASKIICPVETGALRASGVVMPPEQQGTLLSVTMGYGGPAAPYAVYVHERLDLHHAAPTQAKFLERPALEAAAGLEGRLAASLQAELGRAAG